MEVRVPQMRSERSALEIRKTKQIEAMETQRQEVSLKVEGSPPVFVWELTPLKVMDGEEVKFVAKVQGEQQLKMKNHLIECYGEFFL